MQYDIRSIASRFQLDGEVIDACPLGAGHINDTWRLTCRDKSARRRYVLQRINHHVFADPPAMMDNIRRVTDHIRQTLARQGSDLASRQLTVVPTFDNGSCFHDTMGNYWRTFSYIEGAFSCDTAESLELAHEAARMFGWFQRMLTDLPGPPLNETIPDFHNTPKRLHAFQSVLAEDPVNRAAECKPEIDFVHRHASICGVLLDAVHSGRIPVRTTHNDTKINNVMIDEKTRTGVCVIDLDTVMPGLSLYDFGDMVRTAACPAAEDEQDLAKIVMRIDMFEAIVRGFAEAAHTFLTHAEKKQVAFSGKLITFEQMMRFLTDHLAGDTYYKIHRPAHNLDRARTQMKLVQSIVQQEEEMNALADSVFEELS